jgi:hypothetical protein
VYVAAEVDTVADIRIEAPIPVEGTYTLMQSIPTEIRTVTIHANIDLMVFEEATMTLDKDSFAVKSMTSHTETEIDFEFSLANWYDQSVEYGEGFGNITTVVTEVNYDMVVTMDAEADVDVSFGPYLDIFDFPITEGEEWSVASTMTATGNITGSFETSGLPEGALDEFIVPDEGELGPSVDLSVFDGELGGMEINDGRLNSSTEQISFDMKCDSISEVHDDALGDITVCELLVIQDGEETGMIFYYSPDVSMLAYVEISADLADSVDLPNTGLISPIDFLPQENLRVSSMDEDDAAQGIYDVSGVVVSEDVVQDGGDGDAGISTTTLIVIGAVAALAIIIVAVVLLKRK